MKRALKYLLLVCLPAALLTAAGIVLLTMARKSFIETESVSYGRYTDGVSRAVGREIGKFEKGQSKTKFSDDADPAFHWSPHDGLVDSQNLPSLLEDALAGTNVLWKAENRKGKDYKTGWMHLAGEIVAWRRLADETVAGGVAEPFEETDAGQGLMLFAVGFVLVGLVAAFLFAGGYDLWRSLEREHRENVEKTSFLSNATHELKTPLAAIRLWSEMLAGGRLKADRAQHAADVIVEENARMIRLVENLLDFSRLEQKRRSYREEEVDLRSIVDETVELLGDAFAENGISVKGEDSLPVRLDSDAVRQILVNLVGNAAKYAASGGPVEVEVVKDGDMARVCVMDHGPGMPHEELERVFERFFRGTSAVATEGGGLGLGLAISQGVAHGMGGKITVDPRDGGGLVLTFEVPIMRSSGTA